MEVSRFLVDHLLVPSHTSHCHLDADHHVQHEIPVVVAEEDHGALGRLPSAALAMRVMDVSNCLFLLKTHIVVKHFLVNL